MTRWQVAQRGGHGQYLVVPGKITGGHHIQAGFLLRLPVLLPDLATKRQQVLLTAIATPIGLKRSL